MMAEQFKQFKIGELFNRAQLGDANLKKTDLTDNGELVVTSGKTNCGILGRTTRKAKIFSKNTITVDMFGLVYYRDFSYKMVTHGRVMSLSSDIIKNREIGLYLAGSLSYLSKVFSYNNMATWKKIKELNIMLPVTPAGDPDFEYMTARIRELEAERIRELEAYLGVTGLDDTTLSASEAQALTQKVQWKKFRIGDVFERVSLPRKIKHFKKSRDVSTVQSLDYNLPLVNSKVGNNGVMYYGKSSEWNSTNLAIDIIQDGAVGAGMVYAHPDSVGCLYNAYLIRWKDDSDNITPEVVLYFATMIRKAVRGNYNYQHKATWDRVQENDFLLPVTSDGQIDFNYMQNYIRATEKQTIKGVVEYKDRVIAETKKVVGK